MKRAKECLVGNDGLMVLFECPGCKGLHGVTVKAPSNPAQAEHRPVWGWNGCTTSPTFTPSILVNAPGLFHTPDVPTCHSFVEDGRIRFLGDCTHALAGRTVDLPEWD